MVCARRRGRILTAARGTIIPTSQRRDRAGRIGSRIVAEFGIRKESVKKNTPNSAMRLAFRVF
jgi:hypothetical protein